jgi:hypothetical protein
VKVKKNYRINFKAWKLHNNSNSFKDNETLHSLLGHAADIIEDNDCYGLAQDRIFSFKFPLTRFCNFAKLWYFEYRISANSFRGNYCFLNLALFTVNFDLYFINLNSCRGNYSREETIQGWKVFAEIRYKIYRCK